jgi:virginiamycin B lyase
MWFVEGSAARIGRIRMSGQITEFSVPTPQSGPHDINLGPDRNLWFVETSAGNVGRLRLLAIPGPVLHAST